MVDSDNNSLGLVYGLEKSSGNTCPRCGTNTLNIFYEDGADLELGAVCDECGLRGFFVNGKLVELATA